MDISESVATGILWIPTRIRPLRVSGRIITGVHKTSKTCDKSTNWLYGVSVWQMGAGISKTISGSIFKAEEFVYGFHKTLRLCRIHSHKKSITAGLFSSRFATKPLICLNPASCRGSDLIPVIICAVLSYRGVVYRLYMLYFKISCVYCCSCLVCIVVSCLMWIVVVLLYVLLLVVLCVLL